ncbi:MAG: NAD(P)/FAD-dependent oxidoreductase [Oscillospiraceae bacterium]|jgi:protoporphyrinogen oxidase|nr:NAD(P)/FAD-dependent oxidoreductase [Oscillospiraceae bacterium]
MKRVIIIGAGPAGLTAAHDLLTRAGNSYAVTILEESGEIGGISRTVRWHGNRMDIGGHRFFSKESRVNQWWAARMPAQGAPSYDDAALGRESTLAPGGPDPQKEDRVMLTRRRVSRIYYHQKFFDYPITMKPQTFRNLGLASTFQAGCSYLHACTAKLPETSLENFYINRFGKKLYSMFFEGYTEKLWGRHPRDISADWGSQRVKGLSVSAVLKDMLKKAAGKKGSTAETSLIEQFQYPKYGPGQLWEQTADEIEAMGGTLRRHCRVTGIHTEDGKIISVTAETAQGTEVIPGDIFLSSMPVKDLVGGMENVPWDIASIAAGLPYRDFVTVGFLVKKLNLKNETNIRTLGNIVPDCWIYIQDTDVRLGRLQIFNNWSPYMVEKPADTVWIGLEYFCTEGDAFWSMTEQQCTAFAAEELLKMGVLSSADDILDSHRERVKKAYPAYFDTYSQMDTLVGYLNQFSNLYCIGRNGQHRYNNMDHSMMTAFLTVDNILSGSTDKSAIWNVNTDTDYQEEKEE